MTILSPTRNALPLAATAASAAEYVAGRLTRDPAVRRLVKIWQFAAYDYRKEEMDGVAAWPAVVCSVRSLAGGVVGSGRGGSPTEDRSFDLVLQILVPEPAHFTDVARIWQAVRAELMTGYRAKLPELWAQGISRVDIVQEAAGGERPDPESKWAVGTGVVRVTV